MSGTPRTDPYSEEGIIERCRKGDAEAFGRFVDLYQNRVFGFVRRMVGDADTAADVCQDTFVRAFQNFHRFDGRCSARTWLFRIAHNLCIDRSRRKSRQPIEAPLGYEDEGGYEDREVEDARWQPEELLMNREFVDAVEASIARMSEKLRSVFLLADREEMPYDEISALLSIPVGTVKSRLFLARAHLQKEIGAYLEATR